MTGFGVVEEEAESRRLETVAAWYDAHHDFDANTSRYGACLIAEHAVAGSCLEVGCGTGVQTIPLAATFRHLVAFDGSAQNVERTRGLLRTEQRGPHVEIVHALAESFDPSGRRSFDNIVMTHFLEHVAAPIALLRRYRTLLARGGALHITVPNALSLHREIGMTMGFLTKPTDLSERDVRIGHRRVYTPTLLRRHIRAAGLRVDRTEGILLKPFSNAQMEGLEPALIEAFFAAGRRRPNECAEIYVRCRRAGA